MLDFDEAIGHAHDALADARVTTKLFKQVIDEAFHTSPRAQEIRQRWGTSGPAQTSVTKKCPELGDLLLKLRAEGK